MNNLTLKQVLQFAKTGELSSLGVVNDYEAMCNFINLVLIELHSRFVINQKIIEIPLSEDKTTYKLTDYL